MYISAEDLDRVATRHCRATTEFQGGVTMTTNVCGLHHFLKL